MRQEECAKLDRKQRMEETVKKLHELKEKLWNE